MNTPCGAGIVGAGILGSATGRGLRSLHVLHGRSPAATAASAIARHIVDEADRTLDLWSPRAVTHASHPSAHR